MLQLLKRVACFFRGHAWPWRELRDPPFLEHLRLLVGGTFACRRCGLLWKDRPPVSL